MNNELIIGLREGALTIYPTETCYAIGCNILKEESLEKIYELKNRDQKKYLTCIVADLRMASKYCYLDKKEMKICRKYMPGPLTLVAKKKDTVPDILNEDFVFRVPGIEFARELCRKVGFPLVSTSANIAGGKNPYSFEDIPDEIKNNVDFKINYGQLAERKPSTIITLRPKFKVIRKGCLELNEG
ncbi:MAG: threonylcarbamoyl-AMP synthase [Candidatus Woesearchaeota archaeon]|nr:MAG: threonylcarbamoyl-AMP synthase [Candidatus Woesearchaeota archaeon]